MRIPFLSRFAGMPFEGMQEHAEKVKECAWAFQQAMECYASSKCNQFNEYREEVNQLESEADGIKRRVRAQLPQRVRLPVAKYQIFMYIKEQDKVLDCVEGCLNWISFRPDAGIPEIFQKDFFDFVDAVITPLEELSVMVAEATKYFEDYSERQRTIVKDIINNLRKYEHAADKLEDKLKLNIFTKESDPTAIFHMVKLADIMGSIADHAENAGDVMRTMIAR
jgi:predicted phosphate transport protein (TIGR00153 family)